jgi:hypothetical protein
MRATVLSKPCFTKPSNSTSLSLFNNCPPMALHCSLYVLRKFEDYLISARLVHGFLRVRGDTSYAERLVAISCKRAASARAAAR